MNQTKLTLLKGNKLKKTLSISLLLLLLQSNFIAQTKKADVQRQRDSLLVLKKSLTSETDKLRAETDKLQAKLDKLTAKYDGKKIILFSKRYGRKIGAQLAVGKIWKGMTDKMMKDSWGKPDKVTRNKEKWGVFTQWTYGKITYFFRDGKLTDWEEKK